MAERVYIREVIDAVSLASGVPVADLKGPSREGQFSDPRQLAMLVATQVCEASLTQIGDQLGGRDHTTVLHGKRAALERLLQDEAYADLHRRVLTAIDDSHAPDRMVAELRLCERRIRLINTGLRRAKSAEVSVATTLRETLGLLDRATAGRI